MTPRSLRFRTLAVLLAALALSSLGCMKKKAAGELVGVYAISGALVENTCGQTALPTSNPLLYNVEIRTDEGVGSWQLPKGSAFPGLLRDDGEFLFETQQNVAVGQQAKPRTDLMPGDFLSLDPDLDLEKHNCTLLMKETMHGSLHRSQQTLDGGIGDAGSSDTEDLTGKNTIEIQPASGSDCSFLLTSQGGSYLALPCGASYELEGALQVEKKKDDGDDEQ